VGLFATIGPWIDLSLIGFLAEQRPNWTFVLIGRLACSADHIINRSNVHFLGKRTYEDLPAYGRQFDAAIIPYRLVPQVYHANPLKLREYLAMGKPVVAVRTPEIEKYADVVEIANSREDFLLRLDKVLSGADSADAIRERLSRVAHESWEDRLQAVHKTVERFRDGLPRAITAKPGHSVVAVESQHV
jgi:glycosyltransferase involved in cell wall biosynthesis